MNRDSLEGQKFSFAVYTSGREEVQKISIPFNLWLT